MRPTFSSHSYAGPASAPTPAPDQHRCRRLLGPPGFSQGAFRRLRRRRPGRITGVIGSAPSSFLVGCNARRLALPITYYYTEGRGGRSRRPERGCAPSQTLDACRGQAPHTPYLNLHNTAGPVTRRDDHDETTSRRTASQPPRYPCRRLHGSSLTRSGAAIPSSSKNATPCYPQDPRRTSYRHAKAPDKLTPALVSVSVPTPCDIGAGAIEPIIPPMFVYVQGRSQRRARQPVKPRRRTPRPVSFQ